MRMREHQVFFRWMCGRDVVNDGTLADWLDEVEALIGAPFATWRQLGRPAQTLPWELPARFEQVDSRIGAGANQELRIRWEAAANPAGIASFEVQASMHPYTGRFVTRLDLRVQRDALSDPSALEAWVVRFERWVGNSAALWAHAHDADDDAMQNIFDPGLLKLGYGVEVEAGTDLSQNAGREVSRGEFRYAINWMTRFGAEMAQELRLDERELAVPGVEFRRDDEGLWLRLAPSPLNPDDESVRSRQRALRDLFEIPALADRTRRTFGFWQTR